MYSVKKSNYLQLLLLFLPFPFLIALLIIQEIGSYITGVEISLIKHSNLFVYNIFLHYLPILIYLYTQKGFVKNSLYLKPFHLFNLAMSFLLIIVLTPTTSLISYASHFFVNSHVQSLLRDVPQTSPLLSIFTIAVMPAIYEEFKVRYLILNHYRYKPFYITCIMSGLFFGMMHLNFEQFFYAFYLGVIFAYLVQVTGSLFIAVFMHFCTNAFSVIFSYATAETQVGVTKAVNLPTLFALLGVNIVTIPIALLILWKITQYNGKLEILKQKPTTLELTLGKKIEEYQPNSVNSSPDELDREFLKQTGQSEEAYQIYLAKKDTPFNHSFWIYAIFFFFFSLFLEVIRNSQR